MLAAILCLDRKTYRSPLSYNTQVGAALALLGIRPEHEIAIIEAGISLPGEMDKLEHMIRPDHGILTVISKAHIGGLGSLENTLEQKIELFKNMRGDSFLVLNADDPLSMSYASRATARVVTFGFSEDADVRAEAPCPLPEKGHSFRMKIFNQHLDISLPLAGHFNIVNALAAASAAKMLGAPLENIKRGWKNFDLHP